jgi:hypothetical protein
VLEECEKMKIVEGCIFILFVFILSGCGKPPDIETARNDFHNFGFDKLVASSKYEKCKLVSEIITETPEPDEGRRVFDITYEMDCPDGETVIKKAKAHYEYIISPKYGQIGWYLLGYWPLLKNEDENN